MNRIVMPELLDELSPVAPEAVHSRQDLVRVNAWMGNASIMARMLLTLNAPVPRKIVELGAGDGQATLKIAQLTGWKNVTLIMVDKQNLLSKSTESAFGKLGWSVTVAEEDVHHFLSHCPSVDLIITNLFLHHFKSEQLALLLKWIGERNVPFVACEPLRDSLALAATRFLWMIGCNHVTRHDAAISVKAGFKGQELSALWTASNRRLVEKRAGLFSHVFLSEPL